MKKLALIFAALLAVSFTAPAFAADNLDLSGSFRVRGWDIKDSGYAKDADKSYFDQRMRVKAKIKASDNAYVVIRADLGDTTWGDGFGPGTIQRPRSDEKTIDFDRLYGVYDADNWTATIGQQFLGLGILEVLDANMTAFKLRLKFDAFEPTFIYGKIDENGSFDDDGAFDDANLYAVNVSFGMGGFDSNAFWAMADDKGADTDAWALGFYAAGKLGMVNLVTELAYLDGEQSDTVDYEGLQFYVKGDANVTDAFNVGAEFLWAAGTDKADEAQLTNLSDFGDFTIADTNAPCATDVVVIQGASPFDFTSDNAGVIGASLFASYKIMDPLTVGVKVAYLTPEEDNATPVNDLTSYSVWAGYDLGSNTSLVLLYNIADNDSDLDAEDETMNTLYARFMITF